MWEEIKRTALLGTYRSQLSDSTLAYLESLGVDTDEAPTTILLQATALLHQQRRVATPLPVYEGQRPVAVADDGQSVCKPLSAYHLQLILDGTFGGVLTEFVAQLVLHRQQLPPESLPSLLEQCETDKQLLDQLRPVLGSRGEWLMQQHPTWRHFSLPKDLSIWQTTQSEKRVALFRYLRHTDPTLSIALLSSHWKTASKSDQLAFLQLLHINRQASDEDFLVLRLDDKKQEIRRLAADLLAHLPSSELVGRMYQRVEECLYFQTGQLIIEPPEYLSEEEERDGIWIENEGAMEGVRATHLGQLLERVPPSWWEIYFQQDASQSLLLFLRTDWSTTVLVALTKATLRFGATDWAVALVRYWISTTTADIWQFVPIKRLIPLLPKEVFNDICINYIHDQQDLIREEDAVTQLLLANTHEWDDSLTLALVQGFQQWLNNGNNYFWNTWHYRPLLEVVSIRAHVALLPQLKLGWRFGTAAQLRWQKVIEQMLRTIVFRRDMRKTIAGQHPR